MRVTWARNPAEARSTDDPAADDRTGVRMADAQDGSLAEWRAGVGSLAARRADDPSEVALGLKKLVMGWEGGGAFHFDN
jgi:hypothetical protein